ncbi:MAG: LAGLIDADG family homing endonuclease, partial [Gemmataceae bacterium]
MHISRRYTREGQDPFASFNFVTRASRIANPDGTVVFEMKDILVPEHWSQVAVDVLAQKYFRKAGVPTRTEKVFEDGVPGWLQRSRAAVARSLFGDDVKARSQGEQADPPGRPQETDARQVFRRLAGCWTYWGWKGRYFTTEADAQAFHDEICFMLASQMAAPNSPQWFNTGLHWAYGIEGPAQGHYFVDPISRQMTRATSAYEHPAPHACFIQSIADDLVNGNGIMDLWVREARIFKYGSGTGTNFSSLRGEAEPLSGGGKSSGLMSFLKIGDRAAGAIKSGGTTRRAAKMVVLDLDHPDIQEFINWKVVEEQKVAALVLGSKQLNRHLNAILRACAVKAVNGKPHEPGEGDHRFDPIHNRELRQSVAEARAALVPANYIERMVQLARQGVTSIEFEEYNTDWNSKAYATVSGQNSNNSVRISNSFMQAVDEDGPWHLYWRTEKEKAKREGRAPKPSDTLKARDLWDEIANAAWSCADPGVQFDTTINEWHTCPADGRINASNPCVTGDTMVMTTDGMVRIDQLLDRESMVIGSDGEFHSISGSFQTGVKPVYRLRTRAGYEVKLTGDHRVLTANRGDVPAMELQKDDLVQLANGYSGADLERRDYVGSAHLDERLTEFLGLLIGDGCLMGKQETALLTLGPDEDAVAARIDENLRLFKVEHALDGRSSRETHVTQPQTTLRLGTSSRIVVDEVKKFAILNEGSQNKRLTDAAFRLDRESLAGILRGLFTAGGTVANYAEKSHFVALDSSSLELLQQVQTLLLSFGIKSKIYRDRRVAGQTVALLPDGKGGTREYPVEQIHSLRILRSSRIVFEREIGFMPQSPKSAQLARLNTEVTTYADRFHDKVESIEFAGVEPVYDLTEPVTHHFVANGIVVHNCSEYMFLDDTACNLASLNQLEFYDHENEHFDVDCFRHGCRR